ncbi:uncharacterized protein LOC120271576 [Dioscorea cayenensis subsp. rotundata]|uniref:Uncharacterized protein LOC120271576 n=1 Tax=Dioscorea cayennensis subsp. rotundata TaxID=55577 RepID=A0AB40C331_DIOCR|nr:uncharacterized protein LOC120271576 [Dioscorea cayenensis subsp. rotundata]
MRPKLSPIPPLSAIDKHVWKLAPNGRFSVKTFYNFLNDGGIHCHKTNVILKGGCPKKINLFNWLAWDNKILTLDNLDSRKCNVLPTPTCVMCHAGMETAEHLLIHCPMASYIWTYFSQLLGIRCSPRSLTDLWGDCRRSIPKILLPSWDLLLKAITWVIWLERNARIFTASCLLTVALILKIEHLVLSWFSAAPESKRAKLEDPMAKVKRSLEYLSSSDAIPVAPAERSPPPGEM